MLNIASIGYATGAIFFLVLALLLMTGRKGRPTKYRFAAASIGSVAWAAVAALYSITGEYWIWMQVLELIRNALWAVFLIALLSSAAERGKLDKRLSMVGYVVATLVALGLAAIALTAQSEQDVLIAGFFSPLITIYLALSVAGVMLIEQLYRNARQESRIAVKYLCIGLGGIYAYDFYLYADAVLLQRIDPILWVARGFINAMVVPVIGVALMRDAQWATDIFVSRRIVFHTSAMFLAGIYLLAMGFGGYYVREYSGSWGGVAQALFLFGGVISLLILLFSRQIRASARVLISKHFFHYKYDYREEWLRFIRTLSSSEADGQLRERTLRAIAQIIESPSGVLWLRKDSNRFELAARWNDMATQPANEAANGSLAKFLQTQEWVVNLEEYYRDPSFYKGLTLPDWIISIKQAWLIVPLMLHQELLGFVVLSRSPVRRHFNWEDCDLLKTAGRQAAVHLAQYETSQALADSRQFEACNRLSAYVVHDLKNLVAQLSLLVSNAAKHKHNPQFMEDAVQTVENSVNKMNRLLAHLRSGVSASESASDMDIADVLREVIKNKSTSQPVPILDSGESSATVKGDKDRLVMILGHVVQNAQDATTNDGSISIRLRIIDGSAIIEISDTGSGMTESFIRERLFRPFDTTKGSSGMGIGAYEARELIRTMGGEVDVESQVNVGTTFRIRLPIVNKNDYCAVAPTATVRYLDDRNSPEAASC